MSNKGIRVLLADDDDFFRENLSSLLMKQSDLDVVVTARNGVEVLNILNSETVDVVLLDVDMPILNGIQTATIIAEKYPHLTLIMLTVFEHEKSLAQALEIGVQGFLTKDIPAPQLAELIKYAHAGQPVMGRKPAELLTASYVATCQNASEHNDFIEAVNSLPPYLRSVFELLAKARPNKAIAKELDLSESTVRSYVSDIFTRVGCTSRGEVAIMAIKAGLS